MPAVKCFHFLKVGPFTCCIYFMLVLVFRTMPEVLFMKTCCMLTDIWSKILFEILFEKYVRPFSALLKNLAQVFMFYFCFLDRCL